MKKYHFALRFVLLVFSLMVSCQTDDTSVTYEEGSNEYVNDWMYEQMKKYYLWNESLPKNTAKTLNPKEYFGELLHTEDRFSYATSVALPETAPKSIRISYGFDISFIEYEGQVYGVILYVLSDSPAERSGLKRGQYIKAINGVSLNNQNFESLYAGLVHSDRAKLQWLEYSLQSGFSTAKEIEIIRGFTFSQSIIHKVISNNKEKTGYIAIAHFDSGLASTLLSVFKEFKNEAVTKVIVDLRYNGGGDVSSATALSILLAPNIKQDDLFIRFKGNKNGGFVNKSFKEALEMNELQIHFETLRTAHPLLIQELYVLCGKHTASASEIIINNLKPFMPVISIGEKTVGKDVAGFAIEDERTKDKKGWILYPVIYKLFNANNEGNYTSGITPTVSLNELQEMEIFALGDPREILINRALNGGIHAKQNRNTAAKKLSLKAIPTDADPFLLVKF
ncbi:S41 family peptidase [Flavobacterium poyangense]|uniref:S41 family peptidase n=1 Tax=Flavobacterium poyangense TaxID=2204302 RepID=UPI00141FFFBA|nr:S41 family peptidase [Flavobacterium sp. JXAS1]